MNNKRKRLFHRLSKWLSHWLDMPARLGRNLSQWFARRSKDRGVLNRAEGWVSSFLLGLLWLIRRPIEKIDYWRAQAKIPQKKSDPRAEEAALKLALKKKAAAKRRNTMLAKTWVGRVGAWALRPFSGLITFGVLFVRTRSRAVIWWSVPVIVIAGLLSTVAFYQYFFDNTGIAAKYESALVAAINAGDTEQADRFRLKLEQLGVVTDRGDYRVALAMATANDLGGAYARMQQIAPRDKPGYPSAHYWIAQNMLDGKLGVPVEEATAIAIDHIRMLRILIGDQPDLSFMEALANFRVENYAAAKNILGQINRSFSPALALRIEIALRQDQRTEAREDALALLRQLTLLTDAGRELTDTERQWQVAASQLIGDQKAVETAIASWYQANPNSSDAKSNRGLQLLGTFDKWINKPDLDTLSSSVAALVEAARLLPEEKFDLVRMRINYVIQNQSRSPVFGQFRAKVFEHPELPVLLMEHFGALAAAMGEWAVADEVLGRVVEMDPKLASAWNNRAHAINNGFSDRRQEALTYANRAVELLEGSPDIRETRGMIYFNLERWEDAIADLEIAANGVQDLESVHRSLAVCYQKTGRPELAEVYRRQVKE